MDDNIREYIKELSSKTSEVLKKFISRNSEKFEPMDNWIFLIEIIQFYSWADSLERSVLKDHSKLLEISSSFWKLAWASKKANLEHELFCKNFNEENYKELYLTNLEMYRDTISSHKLLLQLFFFIQWLENSTNDEQKFDINLNLNNFGNQFEFKQKFVKFLNTSLNSRDHKNIDQDINRLFNFFFLQMKNGKSNDQINSLLSVPEIRLLFSIFNGCIPDHNFIFSEFKITDYYIPTPWRISLDESYPDKINEICYIGNIEFENTLEKLNKLIRKTPYKGLDLCLSAITGNFEVLSEFTNINLIFYEIWCHCLSFYIQQSLEYFKENKQKGGLTINSIQTQQQIISEKWKVILKQLAIKDEPEQLVNLIINDDYIFRILFLYLISNYKMQESLFNLIDFYINENKIQPYDFKNIVFLTHFIIFHEIENNQEYGYLSDRAQKLVIKYIKMLYDLNMDEFASAYFCIISPCFRIHLFELMKNKKGFIDKAKHLLKNPNGNEIFYKFFLQWIQQFSKHDEVLIFLDIIDILMAVEDKKFFFTCYLILLRKLYLFERTYEINIIIGNTKEFIEQNFCRFKEKEKENEEEFKDNALEALKKEYQVFLRLHEIWSKYDKFKVLLSSQNMHCAKEIVTEYNLMEIFSNFLTIINDILFCETNENLFEKCIPIYFNEEDKNHSSELNLISKNWILISIMCTFEISNHIKEKDSILDFIGRLIKKIKNFKLEENQIKEIFFKIYETYLAIPDLATELVKEII